MLRVKHSVAVIISKGNQTLATRRPDDDDEFPGVWGLPAGTQRTGETIEDVIRRIGCDKLGVKLTPIRRLSAAAQNRASYRLEMELWEVVMEGNPTYPEWQWTTIDLFQAGAAAGSLCCQLAIQSKSRVSS